MKYMSNNLTLYLDKSDICYEYISLKYVIHDKSSLEKNGILDCIYKTWDSENVDR
jgi:hypothetical protein